ncbi:unnamed protein product [Arctogadus glacialis]
MYRLMHFLLSGDPSDTLGGNQLGGGVSRDVDVLPSPAAVTPLSGAEGWTAESRGQGGCSRFQRVPAGSGAPDTQRDCGALFTVVTVKHADDVECSRHKMYKGSGAILFSGKRRVQGSAGLSSFIITNWKAFLLMRHQVESDPNKMEASSQGRVALWREEQEELEGLQGQPGQVELWNSLDEMG